MSKFYGRYGCAYGGGNGGTSCCNFKGSLSHNKWKQTDPNVPSYYMSSLSMSEWEIDDENYTEDNIIELYEDSPRDYRICGNCLKDHKLVGKSVILSLTLADERVNV